MASTDSKSASSSHTEQSQSTTMTITRALAELKLLEKRITKQTAESRFMTTTSKKDQAFNEKTFVSSSKSQLQSIMDLIERRGTIQRALILQNAKTMVKIGGRQVTVAEAITMKASVPLIKGLLDRVRQERLSAQSTTDQQNAQMEAQLQNLLISAFGVKQPTDSTAGISMSQPFRDANRTRVVDPINSDELIPKLEATVDQMESELDFVLSESNAVTHITV